jgi:hypothetical protein
MTPKWCRGARDWSISFEGECYNWFMCRGHGLHTHHTIIHPHTPHHQTHLLLLFGFYFDLSVNCICVFMLYLLLYFCYVQSST